MLSRNQIDFLAKFTNEPLKCIVAKTKSHLKHHKNRQKFNTYPETFFFGFAQAI